MHFSSILNFLEECYREKTGQPLNRDKLKANPELVMMRAICGKHFSASLAKTLLSRIGLG